MKISKIEHQKLVDFVTNVSRWGSDKSANEEVLLILSRLALAILDHDRRTHLHEDKT